MARRTDLEVVVTTRQELDKGLREAESRLKRFADTVETTLSAIAWGSLTQQIARLGDETVRVYQEQQRAMSGLSAIARAYGQDQAEVERAIQSLTQNGLLPLTSAAAGLRNLLAAGLGLDQAVELMQVFMDRAAVGRAESISFAQAVENLTQAFKTESSELGDLSGMTENFSQIIEIGAQALGKKVDKLTDAERAQAKYLGVLQLSQPYLGAAATVVSDLEEKQARQTTTVRELAAAIGEALSPAVEEYTDVTTRAVAALRDWVQANEDATRGLILVGGGAASAVAGVTALAGAVRLLSAALGGSGIGLAVMGISALVGALGGAIANERAAAIEAERTAESVAELAREYDQLTHTLESAGASAEEKERAQERLRAVIAELGDLMPELVTKWDAEGRAIELNTEKLRENTAEYERNRRARAEDALQRAKEAEAEAQRALDKFLAEQDFRRRAYILERLNLAGPTVLLDDEKRAQWEQELAEKFNKEIADEERKLRRALAVAQAGVARAQAVVDSMNFHGPPVPGSFLAGGGGAGGGDGAGTDDDPVRRALRVAEHQRTMGYIDTAGYIAALEEIKRAYELTEDQLMDIDERIHRARQQMTEEEARAYEQARRQKLDSELRWLDFRLRTGVASAQDEIDTINQILQTYELTEAEAMSLVERRYSAQERLRQENERRAREYESVEQERIAQDLRLIEHQTRMGELSLQEQIEALENHLARESYYYEKHAEDRMDLEERIYRLKEELREEDLRAQREALAQAEQDLAASVSRLRQTLRLAQQRDLAELQAVYDAQEAAQRAVIDRLQRELELLERRNREEDRALKLAELRKRLAEAEEAGPLTEFITAEGERIWRNVQAEELREQIAEEERQQERERERERLQDRIRAEQEYLREMQAANRAALDERRQYWSSLMSLEDEQLLALVQQTDYYMGQDGWYGAMETWLTQAYDLTETQVANITAELARIVDEARAAQAALESLAAAGSITVPAPATIPSTSSVSMGGVVVEQHNTITTTGDPAAVAAAVGRATQTGAETGFDLAAARAGAAFGRRIY